MYVFSVMWHPTGDTSTVIGLTESHIVLWDLDTTSSRVQVILYSTTDPILLLYSPGIFLGQICDPGVVSSIPALSHTFMEMDHEIIFMVILLPSAESFKKGCCQLQEKVCA